MGVCDVTQDLPRRDVGSRPVGSSRGSGNEPGEKSGLIHTGVNVMPRVAGSPTGALAGAHQSRREVGADGVQPEVAVEPVQVGCECRRWSRSRLRRWRSRRLRHRAHRRPRSTGRTAMASSDRCSARPCPSRSTMTTRTAKRSRSTSRACRPATLRDGSARCSSIPVARAGRPRAPLGCNSTPTPTATGMRSSCGAPSIPRPSRSASSRGRCRATACSARSSICPIPRSTPWACTWR
jgi:hypothetical protein